MKKQHIAIAGLLALASLGAQAQQKPGLWEITSKMAGGGVDSDKIAKAQAQMQAQMAAMSPEQRKMMESVMAKNGVQMGAGGPGGGVSVKVCMTDEMIKRGQMSIGQAAQHGCTSTMGARTGNTQKMSFTCTQPPSTGEGTFTFNGAESYTMQMNVRSSRGDMAMQATGRWLGSDCGTVKPIAMPKQ